MPSQRRPEPGLEHFNGAPADAAEAIVLACCGSRHWARRVVAHRPYPDLESLLAACDEAGYDLSPADVHQVLARESSTGLPPSAPQAAHTALAAAHAAYESKFGHAFVICLDAYRPDEYLDQVLAGIRSRLSHEPDEERAISADELRALVRSRLAHTMSEHPESDIAGAATP
ncbi:2-oxo-4-hydroxy-4-carboxy-5-ureidoimidazoline decarboxylase [Streptomyces peucetius]|uniref:2-oxo-4-hydroxy-4-carboxy-5-ureidoimidazoline decarboxylase n=1 Tax=Streptomyces peucetius TaxID=1950 RepID=A0ABY6IIA2_STRPE|nr:2-oxo-4-hydroxy-4-carboxy-5-ureidoimidazoline decarboxylase [Streptomyces peucetius]UYQ66621.1 2-oxo-4-hydroxy-4-carboxy-5-ureidoimidazoline decarboxylase [Streptomyces peucetius]